MFFGGSPDRIRTRPRLTACDNWGFVNQNLLLRRSPSQSEEKPMNVYSSRTLQLTVLCLALCAAGFAASDASLYVVHGIPGRDVAATLNPSLPVDVLLNDDVCYFKGLIFGSSSGPLTLPAGNYDIKISSANSLAPCTNPVLAETSAVLSPGSATTV